MSSNLNYKKNKQPKKSMNIIKDTQAQLSTELILILSAILVITLITAQIILNYENQITKTTEKILNTTRNTILTKI